MSCPINVNFMLNLYVACSPAKLRSPKESAPLLSDPQRAVGAKPQPKIFPVPRRAGEGV